MSDPLLPATTTTLTKQQARTLEKSHYIRYLQDADLSDARRYFELARLTTRQHDKVELIAGAIVGIVLGWLLGGGTWFGSLVAGALALFATLIIIFLIHWIRSPSAFHKTAVVDVRGKDRELENEKNKNSRREFVLGRLRELINEHKQLDVYFDVNQEVPKAVYQLEREIDHILRVEKFLERYIEHDEMERYRKKENSLFTFDQTRFALEDILQRIVEDEIKIRPPSPVTETDQP